MERKLAAILYADVAGYSRLMGENEERTHRIVAEYLDAITAAVEGKGGRVVHFAGDAVLAEFSSIVVAVECGVAIQTDLAGRNRPLAQDRKVEFRIGINLGDVMVDRDDLFGDGVNVAARLESLADPGGICISGKVYEEVRDKLDFEYEDMGDQEVKNIRRPVRTWRVRAPGAVSPAPVAPAPVEPVPTRPGRGPLMLAAVGAVVAGAVAIGVVLLWPGPVAQDTGKPSIAVLRFENSSANPDQQGFVDGITDDLITDLSKFSGLKVTPRNVSRRHPPDADPAEVARELGVRYVLTGSARETGRGIRVNVALFDARTGGQPWVERYDRPLEELIDLTGKISGASIEAIGVKPTPEEVARAGVRETENAEAKKVFQEGWTAYLNRTPEDFVKAVARFKLAIAIDPGYARAHSALAATYWEAYQRYWHRALNLSPVGAAWVEAEKHLQLAMANPDSLAHRVNSEMLTRTRRHAEAQSEAGLAIALDGNNPFNYVALAQALTFAGRAGDAEPLVRRAIGIDPYHPPSFEFALGSTLFGLERYGEAAAELEKATRRNPEDHLQFVYLVAAYGHLGRKA
ncbi:MAG: adenylate/guanylate cyclase domain-containing protein, partial [Alphaproteobacteria bacterium]